MVPPSYAHPEILRLTDLEAVLASGKYVGRKFDESVDSDILAALDRRLASE
jgi:hypothetical protein